MKFGEMLIKNLYEQSGASSSIEYGQKRRIKWRGLRDNGK